MDEPTLKLLDTLARTSENHKARLQMVRDHISNRFKQHTEALKGWQEPTGFLIPTEPDLDERRRIRDCISAALSELHRLNDVLAQGNS